MSTYSIKQTEFTPAEVEQITGVAVDLQRNWRRRGFLDPSPNGKHARFRTDELGYLMALKAFSDAGVSIDRVREAASVASLPIFGFIGLFLAEEHKTPAIASLTSEVNPSARRYVIVGSKGAIRTGDMASLNEADALVKIVFDCEYAASVILKRSPRDLITITIGNKSFSSASKKKTHRGPTRAKR